MKNLMVANFQLTKAGSVKRYDLDALTTNLKAQIENSITLGWDPADIVAVTNFEFEFMGVTATHLPLNEKCLTGSKMFAVREHLRNRGGSVWAHDLDAWQCVPFDPPMFKDIGIATYSRPKFNGGSVFIRPSAFDIIDAICNTLESEKREEPTLEKLLKSSLYRDRITVLNYTWNVGCSGFVKRYTLSEKPIKVVHFHPSNRMAWDTHARNRNGISIDATIPARLKDLMVKYFGDIIHTFVYEDDRGPLSVREIGVRGKTGDLNATTR